MEPPIELSYFLDDPNSEMAIRECNRLAQLLTSMGACNLRDPRVTFQDNEVFLDMVESYFSQPEEIKLKDVRKEYDYQIGATPEGIEFPRCARDPKCKEMIEAMEPENQAHYPSTPDVKWRYFHRLGDLPPHTEFPSLNVPDVIPSGFPDWKTKMDNWGKKLMDSGITLAEMAAVGFQLPRDTFTRLMHQGPHLLAPTASDLGKYNSIDTILAGFHQDLNFVTLHGRSRFPGLYIWLRGGKKIPVSMPEGCLLAQAGMQFEFLTAGRVTAGFHEVVVNSKTLEAIQRAKEEKRALWRISSTVFLHIASDQLLRPFLPTDHPEKYQPLKAGHQVQRELQAIDLKK